MPTVQTFLRVWVTPNTEQYNAIPTYELMEKVMLQGKMRMSIKKNMRLLKINRLVRGLSII